MKKKLYEFRLFPTKNKKYTREHCCDSEEQALFELWGMMYALYFEYKKPYAELYCNGKLIKRVR